MKRDFIITWLSAAALFIVISAIAESFFRKQGYQPHVPDNNYLWYYWYQKTLDDPQAVALVGDSRLHTGFALDTFEEHYPERKPIMLAVDGSNQLHTLLALADEPDFSGLVLFQVSPEKFELNNFQTYDVQRQYLESARDKYVPADAAESLLKAALQEHLAILNPQCSPISYAKATIAIRQIPQSEAQFRGRFNRELDVQLSDQLASERLSRGITNYQLHSSIEVETIQAMCQTIEQAIQQIRSRGGDVALLHYPIHSEYVPFEQQLFPKEEFWDTLVAQFSVKAFYYEDYFAQDEIAIKDGLHVELEDKQELTKAIIRSLDQQDFFTNNR